MPYLTVNNNRIFYNEKGSGKPLIMLHGAAGSSKSLKTEIKYYGKRFRVLAFDLPGYGRSDRLFQFEGDYWKYAAFLIKLILNHLKIDQFNIIATGNGSYVALHLSIDDDLNCRKMVLDSFEGITITPARVKQIETQRENTMKLNFFRMFFHYLHGKDWQRVLYNELRMWKTFAEKQDEVFEEFDQVTIPVLLTCLRRDNMITDSVSKMEELNARLKKSRFEIFERGNHPAMLTNKKKYRKLVCNFFSDSIA